MSFKIVTEFEKLIANFFDAPFGIAVDSCTHAIELALRYTDAQSITVPKRTYLSIPMLANKLNIKLIWVDNQWSNYYYLTDKILDAAVYWQPRGYIKGTFMAISFQYQKHLSLGRGGMLLLDDEKAAINIKKMSYDGRLPNIPWREQNINTMGYHYYMTPETAQLGLDKFPDAAERVPKKWVITDWPDLTQMDIFK